MKLGVVVQRFGAGMTGGAEYHARRVAENLAADGHDVTVLTSTSRNARTWDNHYPAGAQQCGRLRVLRFAVRSAIERDAERLRQTVVTGARLGAAGLSQLWTLWGNPFTRDLITHLKEHAREFDAIFFFTCFYFPSLAGVSAARGTYRIGVPLAHDNDYSASPFVADMLRECDAVIANSDEERDLIASIRGADDIAHGAPIVVAGCGIDPPAASTAARPIAAPYVLYIGRKKDGTEILKDAWSMFCGSPTTPIETDDGRTASSDEMTLVTVGDEDFQTMSGDRWTVFGHVSDEQRWALTQHAEVLVNPSLYESLSLTLLESWWMRRPVLARGQCLVMKRQVERASGGLTFDDARSFCDGLSALMQSRARRREMGERGRAYVESRYTWDTVMARYRDVLSRRATRGADAAASSQL
jgi:glycosyltransferase involved in cell wall biosynthesis